MNGVECESPAPPSERARLVVCSPFAILEIVDNLPGCATGEIAVDVHGHSVVRVYVEDGRVCWIAARGLSRRLSDLLRARIRPPISREVIEATFQRGVRERRPLGELLVESGWLDPEDLRAVLLDHTVESLLALTGDCGVARWIPRRTKRFDASFTFMTGDLAVALGAHIADAHDLDCDLSAVDGVERAVTFARSDAWSHPVPIAHSGPAQTSRDLFALGRWAANVSDLAGGKFLVYGSMGSEGRGGVLVTSSGPRLQVLSTRDPRALSRLVSAASRVLRSVVPTNLSDDAL